MFCCVSLRVISFFKVEKLRVRLSQHLLALLSFWAHSKGWCSTGASNHHNHNYMRNNEPVFTSWSLRSRWRPYLQLLRVFHGARGASVSVARYVTRWNKTTEQLCFEAASWDWCREQQRWTDDVSVLPSHPPPLFLSVSICALYLACPVLLSPDYPPSVITLLWCWWLTHAGFLFARQ